MNRPPLVSAIGLAQTRLVWGEYRSQHVYRVEHGEERGKE